MNKKTEEDNEDLNIYRLVRLARGLTTSKLAEMSGVSQNYISQIESNRRTPSSDIKEKLAKALNVSVNIFEAFDFPEKGPTFFERSLLKVLVMLITN